MEQNSKMPRLHGLDGIRGIAIILVILNHVDAAYIIAAVPEIFRPLLGLLFSSGVTGVSLLFILSGFFMAYIYPSPKSILDFLQKRYTRIFPLFLTMCTAMLIIRNFPELSWFAQIALILGLALVTHGIWVYGIKKLHSKIFSRALFIFFLALQVIVGLFYALFIMRQPAMYLNQELPLAARETIIGLVNATLTLPFGDYVPMLDGVYWSLGSEVLFYIIYPILVVPLIALLIPQKRWLKITYIFALIPMIVGLYFLSHNIAVLSMFQFQLFFYFVTGMTVAYLYKSRPHLFEKFSFPFASLPFVSIGFFFVVILLKQFTVGLVNEQMLPWLHILWAFPLTYLIVLSLNHSLGIARFLSTKVVVFLGTISYSMYLSHTAVSHFIQKSFLSTDLASNIMQLCLTFFVTVVLSYLLYQLLEKPYFMKSEKKSQSTSTSKVLPQVSQKSSIVVVGIIIVFFIAIFSAFQSNFNFFSKEQTHSERIFIEPNIQDSNALINMKKNPEITFSLQAKENNFGIVVTNLKWLKENHKGLEDSSQQLVFKIKEKGATSWYTTSGYFLMHNTKDINESSHIFGFPTIADSKGKWYVIEISFLRPDSPENVIVATNHNTIKSVYLLNKNEVLQNPFELFALIKQRIFNALLNPVSQQIVLLFLPFIGLSLYIVVKKKG